MAEGAFRAAAYRNGVECNVDSAGTASYHIGDPPDYRAIKVARSYGVDISRQAARQVVADDFYRFTHIIALDRANLAGLSARAPRDGTAKVSLLLDAIEGRRGQAVPDPYHGDNEAFEAAWQLINLGVDALAAGFVRDGAGLVL